MSTSKTPPPWRRIFRQVRGTARWHEQEGRRHERGKLPRSLADLVRTMAGRELDRTELTTLAELYRIYREAERERLEAVNPCP